MKAAFTAESNEYYSRRKTGRSTQTSRSFPKYIYTIFFRVL